MQKVASTRMDIEVGDLVSVPTCSINIFSLTPRLFIFRYTKISTCLPRAIKQHPFYLGSRKKGSETNNTRWRLAWQCWFHDGSETDRDRRGEL